MVLIYYKFSVSIETTKNNLFCADAIQENIPYAVQVEDRGDAELAIGAGGGNIAGFVGTGGRAGGFGGRRNGNGGRRDDYQYLIMYLILLYFCVIFICTWCYLWVLCLVHAGIIPDNQLLDVMMTTYNQACFILPLIMFLLPFYWMHHGTGC